MTDQTKTIVVKPENYGEWDKKAAALEVAANGLPINDDETLNAASLFVKDVHIKKKEVKKAYDTLVDPIKEVRRQVDILFKPLMDRYDKAETALKGRMTTYAIQVEDQRRKEAEEKARLEQEEMRKEQERLRKEQEAAEKKKKADEPDLLPPEETPAEPAPVEETPLPPVPAPAPEPIKTDGVTFKEVKSVEVENEDAIPREYWALDMVKIRKVALAGIEIPGVRITKTKVAVVK